MHSDNSTSYSLVFNIDEQSATFLLWRSSLQIGFNKCRFSIYNSIIRYKNCQLYGLPQTRCHRETICDICSRMHHTTKFPNKNDPSEIRCTNCYNNKNYFPVTANSSTCPINKLHLRGQNLTKN